MNGAVGKPTSVSCGPSSSRQRSKGLALEEISRRWKVESLAGIEEAWRDDRLWLLNALGGICDLRCFYHHLRIECGASEERVFV